jgi:protocatechuate 3,4-dioxygenase beta subunit
VAAFAHRAGAQTGGATAAAPAGVPNCVVVPQQEEGPYFVDERLNRSDIRTDPSSGMTTPGTPVSLRLAVQQVTAANVCAPLAGAMVDIWQCDAMGVYSDVEQARGQKFLRGYQITNDRGEAAIQGGADGPAGRADVVADAA